MQEFLAGDYERLAVKCRQLMARAYATRRRELTISVSLQDTYGLVTAYAPPREKLDVRGQWMVTPIRDGNAQVQRYTVDLNDAVLYLLRGCGIPYAPHDAQQSSYCGITTPHHLYTFPQRYARVQARTEDDRIVRGIQLVVDDRQCVLLGEDKSPFAWVAFDYPLHLYVA